MFQKINFVLLSAALFFSAAASAEPAEKDMEQLSYCYGVYAATKNKDEVTQNNTFLQKAGDGNAYNKVAGNQFYRDGYAKASTLDKKEKSACYMMVYGFLGTGYSMAGRKDPLPDLDLAYCMGYINEARDFSDTEMMQEYCNTVPVAEKTKCLTESIQTLQKNIKYQAGRKDARSINPVRVMNCGMKLNSATEQEFVNSMEAPPTISKIPKRPKPRRGRENITRPLPH